MFPPNDAQLFVVLFGSVWIGNNTG